MQINAKKPNKNITFFNSFCNSSPTRPAPTPAPAMPATAPAMPATAPIKYKDNASYDDQDSPRPLLQPGESQF